MSNRQPVHSLPGKDSLGQNAGAFRGVDAIPSHWIETVTEANPETDMVELAKQLTHIIIDEYSVTMRSMKAIGALI